MPTDHVEDTNRTNTGSENIQSRHRDAFGHRKMRHANNKRGK